MSKILGAFLCVAVFAVGLSIGVYFSLGRVQNSVPNTQELTQQIQDIVIKQVQAEQNEKYSTMEVTAEPEIKISPYAKLTVEKYFTKCEHTTVDIIDVPKELINMTEKEFREKYNKWEVKSFDAKDISIYREIDANCSSHFVIKEKDGYLAVYNELTDEIVELKEKTDIEVATLREEDQLAIANGIKIYGEKELSSFIEDFNS